MWFGSWTHATKEIDMQIAFPGGIDLSTFQSDYKDSSEWEIIKPTVEKLLLPPNDPNPIAVISVTLQLQRKVVFQSYILTLPCVFLAFLTTVVFCMPSTRPDRQGIGMYNYHHDQILVIILVLGNGPISCISFTVT